MIAIYPFPLSSKNNKYISLLYSNLTIIKDDFEYEIINCENKFTKLFKFSKNSAKFDKNIVHIHWTNSIYGSKFLVRSIFLMVLNFSILVYLKKVKRFKIFWTKHNYFSHDFPYPFIDGLGRAILFRLADKVIIQQSLEYEKVKQDSKFLFIPHGNYVGVYGILGNRNKIRTKFGIKNDEVLIISLGIIKPYKKIENVIRAFKKSSNTKLKLLIAGQCSEEYDRLLKKEALGFDRIIFDFNFIEDNNVSDYFAAADLSVFWYDDSVLTSGGVVLSLSYGTPVITRNIAASELIKDGKNGFIYNTEDQLVSILNGLNSGQFDRESIVGSVENLSWESIAKKLAKEFSEI
ncbi:MAG: hypothetical protein A2817_01145 [Candidatus Yanofskybacteria bacterium RIFCSPHIGHO2_01_FULL_39_8b]|uniref:Glycosyl transferase family 1 domain-containing protein n=1 Tax=Candidatus Yanofskybacteria bacterium RIFCSPHIGHO2_01_FULL_39_8b TaxID=1802659 RepID=A0A1F8EFA1_9BACT|nr:hypothetical protein [uncultured bacterium]OGM99543.1 MAG: hypothetical protein A2817_01145 [Candidatus Yanofskybacteria bacterium RIFCSPHIGHO2_01_FULL_39_8b]